MRIYSFCTLVFVTGCKAEISEGIQQQEPGELISDQCLIHTEETVGLPTGDMFS